MTKRLIPIVVLVVIGAALGLLIIQSRRQAAAAARILGSGLIESDEFEVSARIPGRVSELSVDEGDRVEAGQVIGVLEHADIDAEMKRAHGKLISAEATLRELERGPRAETIRAARARLAQAAAGRQGAARQLKLAREAYDKCTELKQQVDAAREAVRTADEAVAAARAQRDEAEAGPTAEQIEAARAAVRQAEALVASAQTALGNAEAVYARQIALEAPLVQAQTELIVADASAALAGQELTRATALREADAGTQQALDQAQAQHKIALARLDGGRRSVPEAEKQIALTRAQAAAQRDAARTRLAEAERSRDAAQAQLEILLAGTREERVRLAEANLRQAQTRAEAARVTLENAQQIYDDRLAAREKMDLAATQLDTARAQEKAARAELDLLLAGNTAETIEIARGRVQEARAALEAAQVRRSYCDLRAPCTGTVTERVLEPGEMAAAGAPVVVVRDLEHLWLRAYLSLENWTKIKLGQKLQVRSDAVPELFEGTVIRVSDEAEFTPKDVQTVDQRIKQVYWIKIGLGRGRDLLKPGMPADVLGP